MDPQQPRSAGRPRDPELDVAIRAAAIDLLGEGGVDACALDEVARRAGVGKATIYRRWASKDDLVLDALRNGPALPAPTEDHGDLVGDARAYLQGLVEMLGTPLSRAMRQLLPHLEARPELGELFRHGTARAWQEAADGVVDRAVQRGEVAGAARLGLAVRAAGAVLTGRWLMHLGPVDDALVEELLDAVIRPQLTRD